MCVCVYFILCSRSTYGRLVAPLYNFQPLLTRAEVYKVGVTHYFKPDKARNELGYRPLVPMKEGMGRVLEYYSSKLSQEQASQHHQQPWTYFLVLSSLVLVLILYIKFAH